MKSMPARIFAALCLLLWAATDSLPAMGVLAAGCKNWNRSGFFETGTVQGVIDCLQAGADPKARGKWDYTPPAQQRHRNRGATERRRRHQGADQAGLAPPAYSGLGQREPRRYHRAAECRCRPQAARTRRARPPGTTRRRTRRSGWRCYLRAPPCWPSATGPTWMGWPYRARIPPSSTRYC